MSLPRRSLWVAALVTLVACDDKPSKPQPTGPPRPTKGLFIADEPASVASVLAIGTEGETALRFVVATSKLGCDALKKVYPERPEVKFTMLDFWLMQPMEADGSRGPWTFRSAYLSDDKGGRGMTARGGLCDDVIQAGDKVTVKGLELALGDATLQRELLWTGDLVAEMCERVPRAEEARPQAGMKLSIGGQSFPVGGASLRPEGKRYALRLTSAPHDCNSIFTEGYDHYLTLMLEGDPPKVALASLQGDIFPDFPSGSEGKDEFQLELSSQVDASADGPFAGEGPVVVTMEGTLDLRGYAVKLEGKLEALRCKKP